MGDESRIWNSRRLKRATYAGWVGLGLGVVWLGMRVISPQSPADLQGNRLTQRGEGGSAGSRTGVGVSLEPGQSAVNPLNRVADARPAVLPASTSSTSSSQGNVVQFNGKHYRAAEDAAARLVEFQGKIGSGSSSVVLLGLVTQPSPTQRTSFAENGVVLLAYVPENGWIARIHGRQSPAMLSSISFFKAFDSGMRLHRGLQAVIDSGRDQDVGVYLHVVRDRSAARLLPVLGAAGFDVLTAHSVGEDSYVAGTIAAGQLSEFIVLATKHPDVLLLERGGRARLLNDDARRTTQSGSYLGPVPFFEQGIYGSNQVVAICDTGIDLDSCFYRDEEGRFPATNRVNEFEVNQGPRKVIAVDFLYHGDDPANPLDWDNHGHGTSVSGCVAGSDLEDPLGLGSQNGMAPGAKLIIQDGGFSGLDTCSDLVGLGCPVTNYHPALLQAVAQGAVIHNNSWGDQEDSLNPNTYTEPCRELDAVTWSHKHFLVVCAAGNGSFNDRVSSPSIAKNALSVAASSSGANQESMASFSSRGWASDGRFKPDLTAPGRSIAMALGDTDITTANCGTRRASGTSFSSPIVAGLAALVRDYFAQGFYPTGLRVAEDERRNVSAALVKAVLINSSVHMANAISYPPARDQGWGRVNLSRTLTLTNSSRRLWIVDHPPVFERSPALPFKVYMRLRSTSQPLKITLTWTDYPATPGAERHLVNDLDLRVRTPEVLLKGNVFSGGQSFEGGDYDRLNNVEQVEWTPTTDALVEVSVWAHAIAEGPQDFALVISGDIEEFSSGEDVDKDGLPDLWEQWYFGGLSASPSGDPDRDDATNLEECLADTNPTDGGSVARLKIQRVTADMVELSMRVSESRRYMLESSPVAWPADTWTDVADPFILGRPILEGTAFFTNPISPQTGMSTGQHYRVRISSTPDSSGSR